MAAAWPRAPPEPSSTARSHQLPPRRAAPELRPTGVLDAIDLDELLAHLDVVYANGQVLPGIPAFPDAAGLQGECGRAGSDELPAGVGAPVLCP
jgi:hypothetical protein